MLSKTRIDELRKTFKVGDIFVNYSTDFVEIALLLSISSELLTIKAYCCGLGCKGGVVTTDLETLNAIEDCYKVL